MRAITVTAVVAACLLALCVSEYANYRAVNVKYEYFVDSTADALLPVNIEIDVAMPCQSASSTRGTLPAPS